jgi:hypothetical protein
MSLVLRLNIILQAVSLMFFYCLHLVWKVSMIVRGGGEGEGGISLRGNLERVFALQPHLFFYPDNKEELS